MKPNKEDGLVRHIDKFDLDAEREAGAITTINSLHNPLMGNCARSTWSKGSREYDGDNPWGGYATRELEDTQ